MLVAAAAGRTLRSVWAVVVSGDVLRVDDVVALRRFLPRTEVYHGYGLTESPPVHGAMARRWPSCPSVLACYEHPTVGELARIIDAASGVDRADGADDPLVQRRVRVRANRLAERERRTRARQR